SVRTCHTPGRSPLPLPGGHATGRVGTRPPSRVACRGAERMSARTSSLRICMVGQRGVPATFGGIERHVEELGSRLAACGHEVGIFCRSSYVPDARRQHLGMNLRYVPTVPTKHMEAITHSALSTLVAMKDRPDIIHYHGVGPALVSPIPRCLGRAGVVA